MAIGKQEIPARGRSCANGSEPFTQGMEYYSVLEEDPKEGFIRKDYCSTCWASLSEETHPSAAHRIFWKSRVPVKPPSSDTSLRRDQRALLLLKELQQSEAPEALPQTFVLALLLARNKMLKFHKEVQQEDGSIHLLYEVVADEQMLLIPKITLSKIETEKVKEDLAKQLHE